MTIVAEVLEPGDELDQLVAEALGLPPAPYSQDVAKAFEVVFHMRRAGYYAQTTDLTMDTGREWWHWVFYDYMAKGHRAYHGYGPVGAAICIAAVRAMRGPLAPDD